MCGIAGILRFDGKPIEEDALQKMLSCIAHRGKDHQGMVRISPHLMLGHRRLSIIDLHAEASQPMFFGQEDHHLCITYNGEIYNYRELKKYLMHHQYQFKTTSDTEVLLAAYDYWGEDCLNHLRGMFSFALWDAKRAVLFCARDQLGIKPFYYCLNDQFFIFASESKAINTLLSHQQLNQQALYHYCLSLYVPTNASIYQSIQKLSPAHSMTITVEGKRELNRYWQIAEFETVYEDDFNTQLDATHEALKVAVKRQLQSDVPVGGFLSGGIDSGVITALAAEYSHAYHTYSIGYEGLRGEDNELPYAKRIADRYHTIHHAIYLSAKDAMTYLARALQHLCEPIADPAIVGTYVLAEAAAADGVKVLLNGTGGDEIFSGYTRYNGQLSLKRQLLLSLPTPSSWSESLLNYLPLSYKSKARIKHHALDMLFSTGGSYQLAADLMPDKQVLRKCIRELAAALALPIYYGEDNHYQRMLSDMHAYLPNELLLLLDQMTMAHTLEGRVPLLDIDVVSLAFQFKAKDHIEGGQTKRILKDIARKYLGDEHITRKKQGFAGSTYWWVKHNFAEFIAGIDGLKTVPYFENFDIDQYCQYEKLNASIANDIFILYCFNQWLRTRQK